MIIYCEVSIRNFPNFHPKAIMEEMSNQNTTLQKEKRKEKGRRRRRKRERKGRREEKRKEGGKEEGRKVCFIPGKSFFHHFLEKENRRFLT